MPGVLAVVTARDEEGSIGLTVKALRAVASIDEVAVVDDGSGDRTAEEANAAGARVLSLRRGRGKGGALEAALDRLPPAGVYVLVDGDVGDTASEAEPLVRPVLRGEADVAVGRLPALAGGGFGIVRSAASWAVRTGTGLRVDAPLSGQRALTREALFACRPLAAGFGLETAMLLDAGRLGFRVVEVPVIMRHRPTGRGPSGFVHRAGQGLDILLAVAPRLVGVR
jgi:glycosyltransferase involved in cell wall biosynthesis